MAGAAEALGASLALAGLAGAGWAAWCLWRAPAPLTVVGTLRVLVDHGPYAHSRHPMYLGAALMLAGLALLLGEALLLAAGAAFVGVVDRFVLPAEEARLRERYGGWYIDYAREVPRWF